MWLVFLVFVEPFPFADYASDCVPSPSLYTLVLEFNDEIPDDGYIKLFKVVFKLFEEQSLKYLIKLKSEGGISIGVYTYEIASTKLNSAQMLAYDYTNSLKLYLNEV